MAYDIVDMWKDENPMITMNTMFEFAQWYSEQPKNKREPVKQSFKTWQKAGGTEDLQFNVPGTRDIIYKRI